MTSIHRLCRVTAVLAATLLFGAAAPAGAPQQKSQAPGYYRMMLGDIEVTALSDGTFSMEADKMLTHITPQQLNSALAAELPQGAGRDVRQRLSHQHGLEIGAHRFRLGNIVRAQRRQAADQP